MLGFNSKEYIIANVGAIFAGLVYTYCNNINGL